jgi:dolichyl-phosphate-mannose--protein O-mannosyl transferase
LITIVLLSIVFFAIAAWNVGSINYPVTNWQSTQKESFYVNLGGIQQVQTVYFWVKSGNATVTVYSGSPGNWTSMGQFILQPSGTDYSTWQYHTYDVNSQFLKFDVQPSTYDSRPNFYWVAPNPSDQEPSPFIQVSEIGVQSQSNNEIPILGITGENTSDPTLSKLVDEQKLLEIPPTYMSKMYFDEVYFARAAENYLHHQIPDERTHPPLGKLIQASGIAFFGDTPFGWRIMGVIFATLMIPLMFLLGKKLFGTWIGGFSAAFLLAFDFMHFTMARIGTVDTYVVFFSLLSQLFFLIYFVNVVKNGWKTSVLPLFLAVIFFALGFSTKWFTVFGAVGMLALLAALRLRDIVKLKGSLSQKYVAFFDYPVFLLLGFICLAAVIYFVTYIPDMLAGDSLTAIFNLQNAMLSFHSSSTVTDPASSAWWSWPLMFSLNGSVPRWFDISYLPNNVVSTITVFGNPAVWWIGFACIITLTGMVLYKTGFAQKLWRRLSGQKLQKHISSKGWNLPAVFIIVIFFFSWLPYILISRATYIYHFYLSVPLLCLAITYFINKYWNTRLGKVATIAIFAAAVIMFIVFYPVISGMPVSDSYIDKLKWLPGWFFAP